MGSWDPTCQGIVQSNPTMEAVFIADVEGNLYGTSDRAKWAPSQEEAKNIATTLTNERADPALVVQGEKFMFIRRNDNTIIGKKADKAIVGIATSKIVIVARVDEGKVKNSGNALVALGTLHNHYENSGY
ncbi:profilin [Streptomyces sp. NPDC059104]|uniref:profilin n=1 Tax=Streptomyces sp. NPDC059104 TaxID=3346729 RepID=UPI0036C2E8B0